MATVLTPQQPTLRPFVVFDALPSGCIAYIVTHQRSAPLLRPGDTVVIDTTSRQPVEGELSLIRWNDGTTSLVETFSRRGTYGSGPNGEMIATRCWYVGAYNRPRTEAEMRRAVSEGSMRWGMVDGPFATEGRNAGVLAEKLVGRVVGILNPSFAEPKRIGAPFFEGRA